ncbi:hypothetical protein [Dickeya phage Sucellus]|nr:hypothetical protein [Dickeya phage Sucellus]
MIISHHLETGNTNMAYTVKSTASQQHRKLDMLGYGMPGAGKTFGIGEFKRAGLEPFVLAADPGGLITIKSLDVPFVEINDKKTIIEVIKDIQTGKLDLRQYGVLCLDGLTNLSYLCLKETGESANDRRLDYSNYWISFKRIIDEFRRLPFHIYTNCLEGPLKEGGERRGAFIEGSKFSIQLTGMFNTLVCYRSYISGVDNYGNPVKKYFIQTGDDGIYHCRDRTGCCSFYENSIVDVVNKIIY